MRLLFVTLSLALALGSPVQGQPQPLVAGATSPLHASLPLAETPPGLESALDSAGGRVPSQYSGAPSAIELAMIERTNAERLRRGLPPLQYDPGMLSTARLRAAAQVTLSRLSHFDGATLAFVDVLARAGLRYRLAGENLARLAGPETRAVERAHTALMDSPGHRANILEPSFDRMAVGSARDVQGRIIFAQLFRDVDDARVDLS